MSFLPSSIICRQLRACTPGIEPATKEVTLVLFHSLIMAVVILYRKEIHVRRKTQRMNNCRIWTAHRQSLVWKNNSCSLDRALLARGLSWDGKAKVARAEGETRAEATQAPWDGDKVRHKSQRSVYQIRQTERCRAARMSKHVTLSAPWKSAAGTQTAGHGWKQRR